MEHFIIMEHSTISEKQGWATKLIEAFNPFILTEHTEIWV